MRTFACPSLRWTSSAAADRANHLDCRHHGNLHPCNSRHCTKRRAAGGAHSTRETNERSAWYDARERRIVTSDSDGTWVVGVDPNCDRARLVLGRARGRNRQRQSGGQASTPNPLTASRAVAALTASSIRRPSAKYAVRVAPKASPAPAVPTIFVSSAGLKSISS
jgi:hypothetical protein